MCLFFFKFNFFLSHTVIPVAQKLLLTLSSETPPGGLEGTIWNIWDSTQVCYICNDLLYLLSVYFISQYLCVSNCNDTS